MGHQYIYGLFIGWSPEVVWITQTCGRQGIGQSSSFHSSQQGAELRAARYNRGYIVALFDRWNDAVDNVYHTPRPCHHINPPDLNPIDSHSGEAVGSGHCDSEGVAPCSSHFVFSLKIFGFDGPWNHMIQKGCLQLLRVVQQRVKHITGNSLEGFIGGRKNCGRLCSQKGFS